MGIAHLIAVGDATGESILVHTAIQNDVYLLQCTRGMLPCCGDSKSNGSRFRYAQCWTHIVKDELGQFVHFCLCLMKQVIRLHTSSAQG